MEDKLSNYLLKNSFLLYNDSFRRLKEDVYIFVAKKDNEKKIGLLTKGDFKLSSPYFVENKYLEELGFYLNLYSLTYENYLILKDNFGISPVTCKEKASLGTGDRLGLATPAHIKVLKNYDIFPVLAQQSPRELIKTNRNFKDVLLKAIIGILEAGYGGGFGADADHIKDEKYLMEAIDAGYTMYTLDLSDLLVKISDMTESQLKEKAQSLSSQSMEIIGEFKGKKFSFSTEEDFAVSEDELYKSAITYEKAMKFVEKVHGVLKDKLQHFDLEISIDEGEKDTTVEDHIFVVEYLHRKGIDFWSLAPKFPGEFQKAIDYKGDIEKFTSELKKHYFLTKELGGYKLSLHSGSDKFSIYKIFNEITEGNFHIKTSGTSWLQAINLIFESDKNLFNDLYKIALANLEESKKAYKVLIERDDFPQTIQTEDLKILLKPEIKQLFHISYGVLLDEKRKEIYEVLDKYEEQHYEFVSKNIENHLKGIFNI
ncbi:MAG: tagaturonate epimerase family protein [Thermoanaerobacteraceae bacterium]